MMGGVDALHVTEGDLVRNLESILRRVQGGTEVIIERDAQPVAVIRAPEMMRRRISECLALLSPESTAIIDSDFAKDVDEAIALHRESLEPPAWD